MIEMCLFGFPRKLKGIIMSLKSDYEIEGTRYLNNIW